MTKNAPKLLVISDVLGILDQVKSFRIFWSFWCFRGYFWSS